MADTAWVALVVAAAALVGALGSQLIAARSSLQNRRLELFFQAKAGGYKALLERMGDFGLDPVDQTKYLMFLAAYEAALLFASDDVERALRGPLGLSVNAQRLRTASTEEARAVLKATKWYDATTEVSAAMRNDLRETLSQRL